MAISTMSYHSAVAPPPSRYQVEGECCYARVQAYLGNLHSVLMVSSRAVYLDEPAIIEWAATGSRSKRSTRSRVS
eukprot:5027293-Amphidinium_carterae.4